MASVICQPCITVKDAACVAVCPVDCIHPTKDEAAYATVDHLYINPDDCIDCGACQPECPVNAIYTDVEVPDQWKVFIAKNAAYYKK